MSNLDFARLLQNVVVATYITSWNYFPTEHLPARCLTHVNYAFANVEKGVVVPGDPETDLMKPITNPNWVNGSSAPAFFRGAMEALTHPDGPTSLCNPDLKKLIAVGGWTFSKEFSTVASTPKSRRRFAISLVRYIVRHGFDGADLDWEYPVGGGMETNSVSPEDKANFVLLLKEIRHQMRRLQKLRGKSSPMLLTAATAVSQSHTDNLDLDGMAPYLDHVNAMIYDFVGSWENLTGHNAPVQQAFDESVHRYLVRNFPRNKFVAGIPLYGKQFTGVMGKPIGSPYEMALDPIGSDEIEEKLTPAEGYEAKWDPEAMAGYLWNEEKKEFVTYENWNSSFIKALHVVSECLGGAFTWEQSFDRTFKILRKILPPLIGYKGEISYNQCIC